MPVEYAGTTAVAARLLRYTVKPKPGQTDKERVLHITGRNCRPVTAEREFAATRRRHGTQGATRKSPATYGLPDPGEVATYVRRTRPNGRRYWAAAKDSEEATHVRHDGAVVRQAEARHLITSFGIDEVNPDDPEQVARAFEYVVARHAALYPGEQATFVGQAEGKGGKFHVHTTRNATLYEDMEVDGKLYRAGRKLAGDLTDIDKVRERADRFLAAHGHQYGLMPQRLPSASDRKNEMRSQRDRRMVAEGALSNHDKIRLAFEASMVDPRAVDLVSWKAVMAEHDVTVTEPGWRRGEPPKVRRLSYQLAGIATPVRAKTLGKHYDYASALGQLDAKAQGRPREPRPERVRAGGPRPAAQPTAEELAAALVVVTRLAHEELMLRAEEDELYRWVTARAHDEGVAFGDILDRLPDAHEARMKVMQRWNRLSDASGAHEEAPKVDLDGRGTSVPVEAKTVVESMPQQDDPAAVEPVPGALDFELLDLVVIDEVMAQYGIYRADSAAMYKAGIEPRRISDARQLWDALSVDEHQRRYRQRMEALRAAQQAGEAPSKVSGQDEIQSSRSSSVTPLEAWSVEEGSAHHTGVPEHLTGTWQSEDEENPHAAAARKERARRDFLRRSVLVGGDVPARNEKDREYGG